MTSVDLWRCRVRPRSRLARVLVPLVALLAASETALAGQLKLAWDAAGGATGYRLYYGTSSGNYSSSVDVNQTSATVSGLTDGARYYFAAKAYNSTTTSNFSNEVSAVVPMSAGTSNPFTPDTKPPAVPQGFRIVVP